MNDALEQYEMLVDRLKECAVSGKKMCEDCGYLPYGCSRYFLLSAAAEALDSLIHPQSSGLYDMEEIHTNCTVEVWKNSMTGEVSIGWYEGDPKDRPYVS